VPRKNDFHFFKNHTMGWYWVKVSKNFENFQSRFFHIPQVLTLKNNAYNYCAILISRLATIQIKILRKIKHEFFFQHNI